MPDISALATFLRAMIGSFKAQVSAFVALAVGILMLLINRGMPQTVLVMLMFFVFLFCMVIGSLIEKMSCYWKERKERKIKKLVDKLGQLNRYTFTDKLPRPWPDRNHNGMAWQVLVDIHTETAFLTEPICSCCKTNLVIRKNKRLDGFYLECTDCKKCFDVDDIGQARHLAQASLMGEVRRNPSHFFRWL